MDVQTALTAAREWSLDDEDALRVIEALADAVEELNGWAMNKQVWAVHGSYMDGYQAARRDVLRRLGNPAPPPNV